MQQPVLEFTTMQVSLLLFFCYDQKSHLPDKLVLYLQLYMFDLIVSDFVNVGGYLESVSVTSPAAEYSCVAAAETAGLYLFIYSRFGISRTAISRILP